MIKVFKKKRKRKKRTGNLNMNDIISCKAQRMSNTRPSTYHFKMIKNSPKHLHTDILAHWCTFWYNHSSNSKSVLTDSAEGKTVTAHFILSKEGTLTSFHWMELKALRKTKDIKQLNLTAHAFLTRPFIIDFRRSPTNTVNRSSWSKWHEIHTPHQCAHHIIWNLKS